MHKDTQILTSYKWLLWTLVWFASLASGFYLFLYLQTGNQRLLVPALIVALPVALAPLVYGLVKRGSQETAAVLAFVGILLAFGVNEILWKGFIYYHILGGLALIVLVGSIILPRGWMTWSIVTAFYLAWLFLINLLQPVQRYEIASQPNVILFFLILGFLWIFAILVQLFLPHQLKTLRARLLFIVNLLVLFPLVLSTALFVMMGLESYQDRALRHLESSVNAKEAQTYIWAENLLNSLELVKPLPTQVIFLEELLNQPSLTGSPEVQAVREELQATYHEMIARVNIFQEIFLLDGNGRVFFSTEASRNGNDDSKQLYFTQGLMGGYVVPLAPAFTGGRTAWVAVTPVLNSQGGVVALLGGKIDGNNIARILTIQTEQEVSEAVYLVDEGYRLLVSSRVDSSQKARLESLSTVAALVEKKNGSGIYEDHRGVLVLGAYRWLEKLNLALVVEQDRSVVMKPIYNTLLVSLSITALAVGLTFMVALYSTGGISNTLSKLVHTAERIASGDFHIQASIEGEDEIGLLAKSFNSMTNQLRGLIAGLERSVAERTHKLENHFMLLRRAAEVARDATSIREFDELLKQSAELVCVRFSFDHVNIFLVDERGGYAILKASTNQAGQRFLEQGIRKKVGETGTLGYVTQMGQARVASYVDANSQAQAVAILPETRSQALIPLRVGMRTIGVLDIQSFDSGVFDDETLEVLQIMADQLAIAIESARSFKEMREALRELEAIYGEYTQDSWSYVHQYAKGGRGYLYRGLTVEPATGLAERYPQYYEALHTGKTVVAPSPLESPEGASTRIIVPLELRGQVIGVLNLQVEGRQVSPEMISLYEEIANRLALLLENVRLLQEAQRVALREQQINVISNQVRSSMNIDSIMQNTVRELGKAFGVSRTFIQLGVSQLLESSQTEETL